MLYKQTCAICGKEFVACTTRARYCSEGCRVKGAAEGKAAREEYETIMNNLVVEDRPMHTTVSDPATSEVPKKKHCFRKNCVWISWQDHTRCVMPTCMYGVSRMSNG